LYLKRKNAKCKISNAKFKMKAVRIFHFAFFILHRTFIRAAWLALYSGNPVVELCSFHNNYFSSVFAADGVRSHDVIVKSANVSSQWRTTQWCGRKRPSTWRQSLNTIVHE